MKINSKSFPGYGPLFIVLAASLWALDGTVRRSLYHLPPITIVFFEHLIGSIILTPIMFKTLKKETFTIKLIASALIVSLFGGLLGTLFITTALSKVNYISFSVVFLIQKLQPLFAIISAYILLKEKISRDYVKWAVLAVIAAFFVTFKDGNVNFLTGINTIHAALYALGAAVCWGIGTTLSKFLLNQVSSTNGTILRFFMTTVLGLGAVFIMRTQDSLTILTNQDYIRLVYIALTTGLVAMLLYYKGLKKTSVKTATILELTLPVMAIVIDMAFYKVFLSLSQYIAAVVLMFAMVQVAKLNESRNPS